MAKMASTDEIDKMIDKEDWSQISEPALRKRIQNRISQRKLRAKRKLQNQPIPFNILALTPSIDGSPHLSAANTAGNSIGETFPDPMDALYPPIDLEWQANFDMANFDVNTPSPFEGTIPWSPDEMSLTTPSQTTDAELGDFDFDFDFDSLPFDLTTDDDQIALDPEILHMDTLVSPPSLHPREFKNGNVLIHIDNSRPHTPRSSYAVSSSLDTSNESMSSRGCPVKWSTRMLSRGFEMGASRSNGTIRKQLFRPWKKCTTTTTTEDSPYQSSQEDVVECSNCGCHVAVREAPRPSQQELVEMLIQHNPALAELAKQPNVRIEYELPTSWEQSTRHSSSVDLEMEGKEREVEGEPKYIIIYSGHERPQKPTCSE
ncbi:hypothetical protein CBS147354_4280 [Penicillium roqueforti]|nr:hypothetical protein CBS147354_4280 [Penicillium roqueforti]KAI3284668.1 hypothetical protein DTO002I6_9011 [Penicillium roqueforti]